MLYFIVTIRLTDATQEPLIEIKTHKKVQLTPSLSQDCLLLLKTKSKSLDYSISNEWGGDAIIIGYGFEITVFEKETILQELDNYAI